MLEDFIFFPLLLWQKKTLGTSVSMA